MHWMDNPCINPRILYQPYSGSALPSGAYSENQRRALRCCLFPAPALLGTFRLNAELCMGMAAIARVAVH